MAGASVSKSQNKDTVAGPIYVYASTIDQLVINLPTILQCLDKKLLRTSDSSLPDGYSVDSILPLLGNYNAYNNNRTRINFDYFLCI